MLNRPLTYLVPLSLAFFFLCLALVPGLHKAVAIACVFICGIFIMDALNRSCEARAFRRVWLGKSHELKRLWLRRMSMSWCCRNAAIYAVDESEGRQYIITAFHKMGRRWWHFLPVGAPGCFFSRRFWRRTLS